MECVNTRHSLPPWQWVLLIILLLTASRLVPHPPNFTPVGAMALLAATHFKSLRTALIIPLLAMLISDIFLGMHSSMLYVYGCIAIIVTTCHLLIKQSTILNMTLAAVFSAILFFIITNFGAWLTHGMYPLTLAGLLQAYIAGIPFFTNTIAGHLFFTGIGFYLLRQLPVAVHLHK